MKLNRELSTWVLEYKNTGIREYKTLRMLTFLPLIITFVSSPCLRVFSSSSILIPHFNSRKFSPIIIIGTNFWQLLVIFVFRNTEGVESPTILILFFYHFRPEGAFLLASCRCVSPPPLGAGGFFFQVGGLLLAGGLPASCRLRPCSSEGFSVGIPPSPLREGEGWVFISVPMKSRN